MQAINLEKEKKKGQGQVCGFWASIQPTRRPWGDKARARSWRVRPRTAWRLSACCGLALLGSAQWPGGGAQVWCTVFLGPRGVCPGCPCERRPRHLRAGRGARRARRRARWSRVWVSARQYARRRLGCVCLCQCQGVAERAHGGRAWRFRSGNRGDLAWPRLVSEPRCVLRTSVQRARDAGEKSAKWCFGRAVDGGHGAGAREANGNGYRGVPAVRCWWMALLVRCGVGRPGLLG